MVSDDTSHNYTKLNNAMNIIENGNNEMIIWHSDNSDCLEDLMCNMFLHWNAFHKRKRPFTVTSNLTKTFKC